jgi:hypothetical protein
MGLDFIRRAAPSFKKSWDHGAEQLARADLLTRYPDSPARTCVAELIDPTNVQVDAVFLVQLIDDQLLLIDGLHKIGHIPNAPADLIKMLVQVGGCAKGRILRIHSLGGSADVAVE